MSKLTEQLEQQKKVGSKGLIIYVTAGYPDYETTLEVVLEAERAGADIVELGIPFSDPIADGPVIQKAATLALKAGATTQKTLKLVKDIRRQSSIPLVVMTYVNTILNYGAEAFIRDFEEAGLNGVIVPDLPLEESDLLEGICASYGIDLIQFIAPTSTKERIKKISQVAKGFLYCISSNGVTGVRAVDFSPVAKAIEVARDTTTVPVAIGFGIGTPEAAKEATKYADAVIVGSAVIQKLGTEGVSGVSNLIRSIRQELDKRGV